MSDLVLFALPIISLLWLKMVRKTTTKSCDKPSVVLPEFCEALKQDKNQRRLKMREWEDLDWRAKSGWMGRDLCHNPDGKAVRVLDYYCDDTDGTTLTGIVWFGPDAESHRGLCHGGAMCSLLDDICGHAVFAATGQAPWSGATVQVNCSLKKPVEIGSVLRVKANVKFTTGTKKCIVNAILDDGNIHKPTETIVYAELAGISISGIKLTRKEEHKTDHVGMRQWIHTDHEKKDSSSW